MVHVLRNYYNFIDKQVSRRMAQDGRIHICKHKHIVHSILGYLIIILY